MNVMLSLAVHSAEYMIAMLSCNSNFLLDHVKCLSETKKCLDEIKES